MRSEFLYMNREEPPSEDEQYVALKEIVAGMEGAPVTVRTLDVGSDKLAYSLGEHIAPSVNPALGLRAVRLSLKIPALLEAQIAAILRAGAHGPVRILVPMITSVDEIRHVRKAVDKMVRRLTRARVPIADAPPFGIMIETPGAALAADALANACEFFSLGTNDLTMYTLAIDRGDDQVAPPIRSPPPPRCSGSSASPSTLPGVPESRLISAASSRATRALPRCYWASACAISPWHRRMFHV